MTAHEMTDALTKALEVGALAGLNEAAKTAVKEAFLSLKVAIQSKCGEGTQPVKAIEELEAKPSSDARRKVVSEELTEAQVDSDERITGAAQNLSLLLAAHLPIEKTTQVAHGTGIAQAATGSVATVLTNLPSKSSENV